MPLRKNSPLYLQRVIFIFNENTCHMSWKSICNFKSDVQTEFLFEGNNWNCFMYTISKTVTFSYSDFFNRDAFSWIKNLTSVTRSMFQFIFKRQTMCNILKICITTFYKHYRYKNMSIGACFDIIIYRLPLSALKPAERFDLTNRFYKVRSWSGFAKCSIETIRILKT